MVARLRSFTRSHLLLRFVLSGGLSQDAMQAPDTPNLMTFPLIMNIDPFAVARILGGVLQSILWKYDSILESPARENISLTTN
jgi:hypothetical protein